MLESIISLLLLSLPGYCLLDLSWVQKKTHFGKLNKIIFGTNVWIFIIFATVLSAKLLFSTYVNLVIWIDYFFGLVLILTKIINAVRNNSFTCFVDNLRCKIPQFKFKAVLLFLIIIILVIGIMTLFTPIAGQYDALSVYVNQAQQLVFGSLTPSLNNAWPTFGDSMPVAPILYSWFYQIYSTPTLTLIPLFFFFLILLLTFGICRSLFPGKVHIAIMSIVSMFSFGSLYLFMAGFSLYLELFFVFFVGSSIYTLILFMKGEKSAYLYVFFGIILTLLILSKEFGIFYAWFVIVLFLFYRFRKKPHNFLDSIALASTLLLPFIAYHFGTILFFSYYNSSTVLNATIFRSFTIFIFIVLLCLTFYKSRYPELQYKFWKIVLIFLPIILIILFFTHNLASLGTPFGSFSDPYIQRLSNLGYSFGIQSTPNTYALNLPNIFLSNQLIAPTLIPFAVFLFSLFMFHFEESKNWRSKLLASWFFYALFILYFLYQGDIGGNLFRITISFVIPIAIMSATGAYYLFTRINLPESYHSLIFTLIVSLSLGYWWFAKFNVANWWLNDLYSLTVNINFYDVIVYALLWVGILVLLGIGKKLHRFKFSQKHKSGLVVGIVIILLFNPVLILSNTLAKPQSWEPAKYNQIDSVTQDNWYSPVLTYYNSVLKSDNFTTLGFGVEPLQYFLNRPFIDLTYPRNWLILLPLIQNTSTSDILFNLKKFDITYFLIPSESYFSRNIYLSLLENSTLLDLISKSAIISNSENQSFQFKRLGDFGIFTLYSIVSLPTFQAIDAYNGDYSVNSASDTDRLFFDNELGANVVQWGINSTIQGYHEVDLIPRNPLNFSTSDKVVIALKTNASLLNLDFRLSSFEPWANSIGWYFEINSEGWQFFDLNFSYPNINLVQGHFNSTDIRLIRLGAAVSSGNINDMYISYVILKVKSTT